MFWINVKDYFIYSRDGVKLIFLFLSPGSLSLLHDEDEVVVYMHTQGW